MAEATMWKVIVAIFRPCCPCCCRKSDSNAVKPVEVEHECGSSHESNNIYADLHIKPLSILIDRLEKEKNNNLNDNQNQKAI